MKHARFIAIVAALYPFTSAAQTNLESLYTEVRCDQALPMILTAINDEQSFFGPSEAKEIDAFLLGFGLLAAFEHPKMPERPSVPLMGRCFSSAKTNPREPSLTLHKGIFAIE